MMKTAAAHRHRLKKVTKKMMMKMMTTRKRMRMKKKIMVVNAKRTRKRKMMMTKMMMRKNQTKTAAALHHHHHHPRKIAMKKILKKKMTMTMTMRTKTRMRTRMKTRKKRMRMKKMRMRTRMKTRRMTTRMMRKIPMKKMKKTAAVAAAALLPLQKRIAMKTRTSKPWMRKLFSENSQEILVTASPPLTAPPLRSLPPQQMSLRLDPPILRKLRLPHRPQFRTRLHGVKADVYRQCAKKTPSAKPATTKPVTSPSVRQLLMRPKNTYKTQVVYGPKPVVPAKKSVGYSSRKARQSVSKKTIALKPADVKPYTTPSGTTLPSRVVLVNRKLLNNAAA